jgi:polyphosphate kinase
MNILPDEIIKVITNYLPLKDKYSLSLTSGYFSKIINMNYYMGTFIRNYIGLTICCKSDLEVLKENNFEFLQEISNYLLNENYKKPEIVFMKCFTFNTIMLVKHLEYQQSKSIIKNGITNFKTVSSKMSYKSLSKNFRNVNSLLLC